jgi:hypothetical protein
MPDTANRFTTIPTTPPPGWERETPRYRVARDVHPSPNNRFRFEPPFAQLMDSSEWQHAERDHKAGEVIEIRMWPHAMFVALNFSATKVLGFFSSAPKSRLPRPPWFGDRVRLDDGLTGSHPNVAAILQPGPAA